jgi:hypothetical protein
MHIQVARPTTSQWPTAYSSQESTDEPWLNITPAAVVRVARRARAVAAVAVAGVVSLALDDDLVAAAKVAVDQQRQHKGEEEEDAVPKVSLARLSSDPCDGAQLT